MRNLLNEKRWRIYSLIAMHNAPLLRNPEDYRFNANRSCAIKKFPIRGRCVKGWPTDNLLSGPAVQASGPSWTKLTLFNARPPRLGRYHTAESPNWSSAGCLGVCGQVSEIHSTNSRAKPDIVVARGGPQPHRKIAQHCQPNPRFLGVFVGGEF